MRGRGSSHTRPLDRVGSKLVIFSKLLRLFPSSNRHSYRNCSLKLANYIFSQLLRPRCYDLCIPIKIYHQLSYFTPISGKPFHVCISFFYNLRSLKPEVSHHLRNLTSHQFCYFILYNGKLCDNLDSSVFRPPNNRNSLKNFDNPIHYFYTSMQSKSFYGPLLSSLYFALVNCLFT